eukprot:4068967-Ditylum_brightwellii.AAC.1
MSLPGVPGSGSMNIPLLRNDAGGHPGIRSGYRFFQGGKFNDSKNSFTDVLKKIPLVITENRNEANEVKEMLEICREYITAIRIKGAMSGCASDP